MAKKVNGLLKICLEKNWLLVLISALFLFTRLFLIQDIPSSIYWDEASIGYNAYSVLKTGKDEWGETLPLHFRAFGEFKLPVYVYSVLVSESVFGLNAFSVRLPSVLYGLMSVIGIYLLVMEISRNKEISVISSLLFSISPWYFIFSRTGYEASAGLTFFIWGIYLFLKYKDKRIKIIFSIVSLLLSFYSYNSFRILVPISLVFIFGYQLFKNRKKELIISGLIVSLSLVPLYKLYKNDSGLSRLTTVGAKTDIVSNYFKNFSFEYLFFKGDTNPRSQIPGQSQLYIIDSVFVLLGIYFIYKKKDFKYLIPLIGLIVAPIPAAITRENPHALRSILLAPVFSVIAAFGIYFFVSKFKKYKSILYKVIPSIYMLFFVVLFLNFIVGYNKQTLSDWQYEYKETFQNKTSGCIEDKYGQPYIFALFYQKTEPNYFRDTKVLNDVSDWGFSTVKSFGNYEFEKQCDI